jgi:hypothetical protein
MPSPTSVATDTSKVARNSTKPIVPEPLVELLHLPALRW